MGDVTDRAHDVEPTPAGAPPDRPAPPEAVTPALAAMPSAEAPEAYQPLSLLAIAGFLLCLLYALVVIGGGVVALLNHTPWLLPLWTLLLPIVGVALAWVARGRIEGSEGTLGGTALANWGIGLGVLFGLTYTAYFAATYFAVRQQATDFARAWLDDVRAGKLEQAYLRCIEFGKRPREDAHLRTSLENLGATALVSYPAFQRADFIRLLKQGGPEARAELAGVKDWDFEKGGYQVQLVYQVSTPVARFELILAVLGKESLAGEYEGRQWSIMMEKCQAEHPFQQTPEGERLMTSLSKARKFAQNWLGALSRGDKEAAYLDTLPPAERAGQERARGKADGAGAVAGPAAILAADPEGRAYLAGKEAFLKGGLVRADPKTFWASDPKAVVEGVKDLFRPWTVSASQVELSQQARLPEWDQVGGKLRPRFDVQIALFDRMPAVPRPGERPIPRFQVDGMLVVESTAAAGQEEDSRSWRVVGLELIRGQAPGPEAMMPRRGMMPR
jgi:hypothetical protein